MKIPFQLTAAVPIEKRRENMLSAIARNLPRLDAVPIDDTRTASIVCFGPSLHQTWQQIKHPIISVSGATRFLYERGIVADYHVDMDPREYKVKHITPPVPGVTYLLASVCAPVYFDTLRDEKVLIWHMVSGNADDDLEFLSQHDPDTLQVATGSNVGLGAIQVGGMLGYRHYEVFGMDASFGEDSQRHAAEHFGKVQKPDQKWPAAGKVYRTSKIMANGAAETINAMRLYPVFCVFHGDGLTQALIREEKLRNACCADELEQAARVRTSTAIITSPPIIEAGPARAANGAPRVAFYNASQEAIHLLLGERMVQSVKATMPGTEIWQLSNPDGHHICGTTGIRRLPDAPPISLAIARHFEALGEGDWLFLETDVLVQRDVRETFAEDFDVAFAMRTEMSDFFRDMPYNVGVVFSRCPAFWTEVRKRIEGNGGGKNWYDFQKATCAVARSGQFKVRELGPTVNYSPKEPNEDVSMHAVVHYKGNRKDWMLKRLCA